MAYSDKTPLQKAQYLLDEKNNKIKSENLKKGITVFGIDGNMVSTSNITVPILKFPEIMYEDEIVYNGENVYIVPDQGDSDYEESVLHEDKVIVCIPNNCIKMYYSGITRVHLNYDVDNQSMNISNSYAEFTLQDENNENVYIEFATTDNITSDYIEKIKNYKWNRTSSDDWNVDDVISYNMNTCKILAFNAIDNSDIDEVDYIPTFNVIPSTYVSKDYMFIQPTGRIDKGNAAVHIANSVSQFPKNMISLDTEGNIQGKFNKNLSGHYNINSLVKFNKSYIADLIGLTADKIKKGETILGIEGEYEGPITPSLDYIKVKEYEISPNQINSEDLILAETTSEEGSTSSLKTLKADNLEYYASAAVVDVVAGVNTGQYTSMSDISSYIFEYSTDTDYYEILDYKFVSKFVDINIPETDGETIQLSITLYGVYTDNLLYESTKPFSVLFLNVDTGNYEIIEINFDLNLEGELSASFTLPNFGAFCFIQ